MIRFIVTTKDNKKFLRQNVSKYGTTLNLNDNELLAKQFISKEDAIYNALKYLGTQKTLTARDLVVREVEIIYSELSTSTLLPTEEEFNMWHYGIQHLEEGTAKSYDWIDKALQRKYLVEPLSFDWQVIQERQPMYIGADDEHSIDVQKAYITNIKWKE